MIIDCHYHYYPNEFSLEEKLQDMDSLGIDKLALITPICVDIEVDPLKLPMRFMRFIMGKRLFYPLLKKLLCTFEEGGIRILGQHVPIFSKPANKPVFSFAEKNPDRFMAYATVNPAVQTDEEIREEIGRWLGHECFCGVKVHPFYHQYDTRRLDSICQALEPLHKPLLIHMSFDSKDDILDLADRYPQVNFILAHCAFPYFDLMWKDLRKRNNLYVDISNGCYVDASTAKRALKVLGANRLVYGSDGPSGFQKSNGAFDMQAEYAYVSQLIPEDKLQDVVKDNFLSLL